LNIVLASISFLISIIPSMATMIGSREGSGDSSVDSICIDDSVVIGVFHLVPTNLSQHTRPNAPQLARNHRLLEIRASATAITITVFAFATRRAVRV
jgi:NAD dependent epimerase/dehydratase family enzyme